MSLLLKYKAIKDLESVAKKIKKKILYVEKMSTTGSDTYDSAYINSLTILSAEYRSIKLDIMKISVMSVEE